MKKLTKAEQNKDLVRRMPHLLKALRQANKSDIKSKIISAWTAIAQWEADAKYGY